MCGDVLNLNLFEARSIVDPTNDNIVGLINILNLTKWILLEK